MTPYEIGLLRDKDKQEKHQRSLAAAANIANECNNAKRQAHIFFCWVRGLHESWEQEQQPMQVFESTVHATQHVGLRAVALHSHRLCSGLFFATAQN